jgi:transcriptional regulator with XRE-family HTH domain
MPSAAVHTRPIGTLVREWRERRRVTQLDLALRAEISARHLSFVETGRARPSREMVLHLAEHLEVPLRERNALLLAAGYAPVFPEHSLGDPALAQARSAIERLITAHEPYPAIAMDRHWNVVVSNRAATMTMSTAAPHLLQPPVNVLRLSLHPDGLAPHILNLGEWRAHLLARLRHQIDITGDAYLAELQRELLDYPASDGVSTPLPKDLQVVVPLRYASPLGTLNLMSTTMVFGTPLDITLSELALETFFPADGDTADLLRRLAEASSS